MQPTDSRRKSTASIECPKSMVGRVIGKNGETIKALQTYTGSLIQVNQMDDPCTITISGTAQSLSLAISMVADIVKGTFKGFALLRQVGGSNAQMPGPSAATGEGATSYQQPILHSLSSSQPLSQAASVQACQHPPAQPQPVYAPGYGLIPPWQSFTTEDPRSPASAPSLGAAPQSSSYLPARPSSSSQLAQHSTLLMGLQQIQNQQREREMQQQQVGLMNPSLQSMYSNLSAAYGGVPYRAQQEPDPTAAEAAAFYQDAAGNNLFTTAQLLRAAASGWAGAQPPPLSQQTANWLTGCWAAAGGAPVVSTGSNAAAGFAPRPSSGSFISSGSFANGYAVQGPNSGSLLSSNSMTLADLREASDSNSGLAAAAAAGVSASGGVANGGGPTGPVGTPGGNLVMDASGQMFFLNSF